MKITKRIRRSLLLGLGFFTFLTLLASVNSSFALTFEIADPCSKQVTFKSKFSIPAKEEMRVSEVTAALMEKEAALRPHLQNGITLSFLGTPDMGTDASICLAYGTNAAIQDTGRWFGWCFSVNGKVSEQLPTNVMVKNYDQITWFYCYAEVQEQNWVQETAWASSLVGRPNDWGHSWYMEHICSGK